PPASPLFAYTTLFRSLARRGAPRCAASDRERAEELGKGVAASPLRGRGAPGAAAGAEEARRGRGGVPLGRTRGAGRGRGARACGDRKSTRLNSSHEWI